MGTSDVVGPGEQLDLAGLRNVAGHHHHDVGTIGGRPRQVDGTPTRAAATSRGGRDLGGRDEARFGQIGSVGEAGGLADDDPDAGATVTTRRQFLDLSVVQDRTRRPLVLGEHLGEVGPALGRGTEHPLQY